jgi:hypothetical protein
MTRRTDDRRVSKRVWIAVLVAITGFNVAMLAAAPWGDGGYTCSGTGIGRVLHPLPTGQSSIGFDTGAGCNDGARLQVGAAGVVDVIAVTGWGVAARRRRRYRADDVRSTSGGTGLGPPGGQRTETLA